MKAREDVERVFKARPDWYETGIRPRILRRTVVAAVIIVACVAWWFSTRSWIPVVIAVAVLFERLFEFANISATKRMVASMTVTTSREGLTLSGGGMEMGSFYPWGSLRASSESSEDGNVSTITIEDVTRDRSPITLKGYEAMEELNDIIQRQAGG